VDPRSVRLGPNCFGAKLWDGLLTTLEASTCVDGTILDIGGPSISKWVRISNSLLVAVEDKQNGIS